MLIVFSHELLMSLIVSELPREDKWRLRSSSKRIAGVMDGWFLKHRFDDISMRTGVEIENLLRVQEPPAFLTDMVRERVIYDRMGPLHRWFKNNRVGMDDGGFYTHISDTERVRIRLWETGVDFVGRRRSWLRNMHVFVSKHVHYTANVRDGFVTYDPTV